MPMRNFSTLTYLVNNFQADLNITNQKVISSNESYFTEMEEINFEPSDRSIKNILDFARSFEVLETESTGYVEMILN